MKFEEYDDFVKTSIKNLKKKLFQLAIGVCLLNLIYIFILNIHYIELSIKQQIIAMCPLICILGGIVFLGRQIKFFGMKITNLLAMTCRESLEEFEKNGGKLKYELPKEISPKQKKFKNHRRNKNIEI